MVRDRLICCHDNEIGCKTWLTCISFNVNYFPSGMYIC